MRRNISIIYFVINDGKEEYSNKHDSIFEVMKYYRKPFHFLMPEAFERSVIKFWHIITRSVKFGDNLILISRLNVVNILTSMFHLA